MFACWISSLKSNKFISYKPRENRFSKQSRDLMLPTWSKGHVWEPLTLSQHLAYCGVNTPSADGDVFYLLQDHFIEM